MIFLPIVDRELRVAARRRVTYATRFWAVLAALAVSAWALLVVGRASGAASVQGQLLFVALAVLAFAYCLLIGVVATADCVSEERREGTLGLLFLTDLKARDVVLGKLVARSLNAFYGLLAILPVLALPLMLGGVTAADFGRMALVLVNTMFLSLAVGLFLSTCNVHARQAMFATFGALLLLTCWPVIVLLFFSEFFHTELKEPVVMSFSAFSPVFSLACVVEPILNRGKLFWVSLALVHGLGWIFLLRACARLPRVWQDEPSAGWRQRWRERWRRFGHGDASQRQAFRARFLAINPFLWLALGNRVKLYQAWGYLASIVLGLGIGYFKHGEFMFAPEAVLAMGLVFHLVLKVWMISEASARLAEDRSNGALELMLSTPLTVPELVRGQWLALRRQFAGPVGVLLVLEAVLAVHLHGRGLGNFQDEADLWLHCAAGMVMLVADWVALGWVAMWLGLSARSHIRAILLAAVLVLLLPWLIYFGALSVWENMTLWVWRTPTPASKTTLWLAIGLVNNAVWAGCWARRKLLRDFRTVAMHRYHARPAADGG